MPINVKKTVSVINESITGDARLNDDEKGWVLEQIGCLTASNGQIFVKEMFKHIVFKGFPHQQIARPVCKIKKKDLEQ